MNRFRTVTTGALIAGLLASGAAFAQGPRAGGPAGRGRGAPPGPGIALRSLDLTEAQRQQVREIRERHRAEGQQAAERVREAMTAQRAAVAAIPFNEGAIRATTLALAEAQTEAAIHQARVYAEVWAVLTPAQQEEAKKVQAAGSARTQQRRQTPR